ncbi:MAG: hypothetical protein JW869_03735 [Candidatus Omnitrophica bacterium]|nr:hypothetical protein [Candidatus Omnitrophota bacterium]
MKRMYAVFDETKIIKKSENKKELLDYINSFSNRERTKLRLAKEIRRPDKPQQSTWAFEEASDPKKVIRAFWIIPFVLSPLIIVPWLFGPDLSIAIKIAIYILTVYALWATLWGFRTVFSKAEDAMMSYEFLYHRAEQDIIFALAILFPLMFIALIVVFILGCIYGCLGGGIYQYLQCQKLAKEQYKKKN